MADATTLVENQVRTPPTMAEGDVKGLPADVAALALQTVKDAFNEADKDRSTRLEKWKTYYGMYRNVYDFDTDFPFRSQIVPPLAFAVIETLTPRLINGLFGPRKFIETLPQERGDEERAKLAGELLTFQIHTEMELVPRAIPWTKSAGIYGTAVAEFCWKRKESKAVLRRPREIAGEEAGYAYEERVVVREHPDVEFLHIADFWIDPKATGSNAIDEARYVIRREWLRPSELEKRMREPGYIFVPAALRSSTEKGSGESGNADDFKTEIGLNAVTWSEESQDEAELSLLHYWGEFKDKDGRYHDVVITTVNNKYVIRMMENPFGKEKPFGHIAPTPDPHEFYGYSEIEAIEQLFEAYIAGFNQLYDNMNLILNPMYIVRDEALLDPTELLYPRPGGIIRTDRTFAADRSLTDIVQPQVVPDVRAGGFQTLDLITRMIDRTTGQFDYTRGNRSETANQTATGIMSIIGEANARFEAKIMTCQHQFIKRMARWLLKLNARYLPPGKVIRVMGDKGEEYLEVGVDVLNPEYDVVAIGAPMLGDKDALRRQVMEYVAYVVNTPAFAPYLKPREALSELHDLHELKNPDAWFKTDEELAAEQERAKLQATQEQLAAQEAQEAGVRPEDIEAAARETAAQGGIEGGQA